MLRYIPLHLLDHSWLPLLPSSACMPSFRRGLSDENDTRATINNVVEEVVEGDLVEGVAEVEADEVAVAAVAVEITSEGALTESIGQHKALTPHCHL